MTLDVFYFGFFFLVSDLSYNDSKPYHSSCAL